MDITQELLTPTVDPVREFKEIAMDFSNPLDLVREAISNSFDADAKEIKIGFSMVDNDGDQELEIRIEDNGTGMNQEEIKSFFDLGNSTKRGLKDKIGEKGHGTKVYFSCRELNVSSIKNNIKINAIMKNPKKCLNNGTMPSYSLSISNDNSNSGTIIIIRGYNNNKNSIFSQAILEDYIKWFTKMGSVELEFGIDKNKDVKLYLKGVDSDNYKELSFGHFFPKENCDRKELFEKYKSEAPNRYCKRIFYKRNLSIKDRIDVKFDAVFYIEGSKVKYDYNPMIRHSGYKAPDGGYTVQERYGLWLCKDYLPIQRKNEWIVQKGSEFTKFHAFINCQDLMLTANRGSIENTPGEIIKGLEAKVKEIYEEIVDSDDWDSIITLEQDVEGYNTIEKEKKDFKKRINSINASNVADYEYKGQTYRFVAPNREQGVFSLYLQTAQIHPDLYPFTVIDYDTHSGIDVIVKERNQVTIKNDKKYYVEFKNFLGLQYNHSFENTYSIICWDLGLSNGQEVTDVANEKRVVHIVAPKDKNDFTHYFLDNESSSRKIEVFVLRTYLVEKLGISFRARTADDIF